MAKIRYESFINEDKKTVVTVIYETFADEEDIFFLDKPIYAKFTGKAKCSPEDTFDIELGKKLSLARAWLKRDMAYRKYLDEQIEEAQNTLDNLEKEEEEITNKIEATIAKIEELADSTEE